MQVHPPKSVSWSAIAVALAALLFGAAAADAATKLKTRTVSNPFDSVSEFRPRLVGDALVWQRGSGAAAEVMRRDDNVTVNLTLNGVADENPETDGIHVVWQQGSAGSRNIVVYDLLTGTTTILSATGDEVFPLVSGTMLAWIEMVDADGEVFVDPGPLGNQLTGNAFVESSFQIDGLNVIWSEGDELGQTVDPADDLANIAVWNGELQGLYILGQPGLDDIKPVVEGNVVVWQAGPDGSGDIWYGDTQGTSNPLFDGTDERNPATDGSRVVWEHFDGLDFDLYIVDLASPGATIPFTNDALDDMTPQIEGNTIVWVKEATPGDSEIWLSWKGAPPEPLRRTKGNGRDDIAPQIDGDQFVYESCVNLGQPSEVCDVVLVPEPRATLVVAAALAALALLASRSARRAVELARIPRRR